MKELAITKVKVSSLAGFYAAGFGILGFIISVMSAMSSSLHYDVETASILKGLVFGITIGVAEVIFITIAYAAIGAFIGFLHAIIFNLITKVSDGIVITTKEQK